MSKERGKREGREKGGGRKIRPGGAGHRTATGGSPASAPATACGGRKRHRVVEASGCAGGRQLVVAGQGGAAARVLLLSFFC
ncbi:hypothetical protein V6Z11_A04G146700 [Gossypium hirsutum]